MYMCNAKKIIQHTHFNQASELQKLDYKTKNRAKSVWCYTRSQIVVREKYEIGRN